jgi:DNA-binding transcriptional regulator YiaG
MKRAHGDEPYPECGLDNVVLVNVPVWECRNGHRDVQVPAVEQLHDVLAQAVVSQSWPLKGQDIRFLRKHLGYSVRHFSDVIGLNYVTLSKFENERSAIPRKLNALVRLFCAQSLCERHNRPLPTRLIPLLEQLEASLDMGHDLRMEHVESPASRLAEPRQFWQQELPIASLTRD